MGSARHLWGSGWRAEHLDQTLDGVIRGFPQLGLKVATALWQGPASFATCEEGAPLMRGAPSWFEVVGQRPLPKVGVTELTVARCWMSCTQSW
jgi:hypothetical protein